MSYCDAIQRVSAAFASELHLAPAKRVRTRDCQIEKEHARKELQRHREERQCEDCGAVVLPRQKLAFAVA
jgi:hypothetical protein